MQPLVQTFYLLIKKNVQRHLIWKFKKLSMNSLRDSNSVLDTISHYWNSKTEQFFPKTSSLSTIFDSFELKVLKVVKSKKGTPLLLGQFFITKNFISW